MSVSRQQEQQLISELAKAVQECSSSNEEAAAAGKYAMLRLQLAIAEAQLDAKKQQQQQSSKNNSFFSLKKLLGLNVMNVWTVLLIITVGLMYHAKVNDYFDPVEKLYESATQKCLVSGEDLVMEMARAPVNCEMCRNLREMPIEFNITKERFLKEYAYTAKPVLIKNAVTDWKALKSFSHKFFTNLYDQFPESYKVQDQEGQFFAYKTEFESLRNVLHMSEERNKSDWYIGWSNADENVGKELRTYYNRPYFLPDDAESSKVDWMFMGKSAKGAQLHIDYVSRPSWQAQIRGRKKWELVPSPECLNVCHSFNVTVYPGDIINLDTNRWYHATYVHPGDFSITIGSEYD